MSLHLLFIHAHVYACIALLCFVDNCILSAGCLLSLYSCMHIYREAYSAVRDFIHLTIRKELSQEPVDIRCSGHSLGGALAVLCSIDLAIHTLPAVNKKIIEKNLVPVKKKGFGFGLSSLFKRYIICLFTMKCSLLYIRSIQCA